MEKKSLLKKYDLTIDCLDYKYIENCKDVKCIEKILRILRSGEEGHYPDLIKFCEKKLAKLNPNSRLLHGLKPVISYADVSSKEKEEILTGIKCWVEEAAELEMLSSKNVELFQPQNNLPPVRNVKISTKPEECDTIEKTEPKPRSKCLKPKSYDEWDKYNVDEELKKLDDEKQDKSPKITAENELIHLSPNIDTSGLSECEQKYIANLERIKGNEAYKSQDYEEAVLYYTRSLSAYKTVSSLNNRGQSYMKMKNFVSAVLDFNRVLCEEPRNIKALYRRGVAYKEQGAYGLAMLDFQMMLELDKNNKNAKEQIKLIQHSESKKKTTNTKPVIIEEIEPDKNESLNKSISLSSIEDSRKTNDNEIATRLTIEEISENEFNDCESLYSPETAVMLKVCQNSTGNTNTCDSNINFDAIDNENTSKIMHTGKNNFNKQSEENSLLSRPVQITSEKPMITEICTHRNENCLQKFKSEKPTNNNIFPIATKPSNDTESSKTEYVKIHKNVLSNVDNTGKHHFSKSDGQLSLLSKPIQKTTEELIRKEICLQKNENRLLELKHENPKDNTTSVQIKPNNNKNASRECLKNTENEVDNIKIKAMTVENNDAKLHHATTVNVTSEAIIDGIKAKNGKITPFEFLQTWNSIKANKESNIATQYLESISPSDLPQLISNKLDSEILMGILNAVKNIMKEGKYAKGYAYLKSIMTIPRLPMIALFLSPAEKKEIQALFNLLDTRSEYRTDNTKQFRETLLGN